MNCRTNGEGEVERERPEQSRGNQLVCNMDKCAVFVAYYRCLDRYYNFIFAGRKISREENFAKFHSQWILFSREENFAQNPSSRI